MRRASNCLAWLVVCTWWDLNWNAECACAFGTQAVSGLLPQWTMRWTGKVLAGQNCGGGRWTGKPREQQSRAYARCRDGTVGCQATLLLLLIRTGCPSWWVVVCPVHEASWPGSRALITVLMLACSCRCVFLWCRVGWVNEWLSGWNHGLFIWFLLFHLSSHWSVGKSSRRGY